MIVYESGGLYMLKSVFAIVMYANALQYFFLVFKNKNNKLYRKMIKLIEKSVSPMRYVGETVYVILL